MMKEAIRARIKERGLKKIDIAKEMGCSPSYVSQLLAPHTNPTVGKLDALMAAVEKTGGN